MPGGDGTGPLGGGPMTGRGAGYCAGYPAPGYANQIYGRGQRLGGFGRGLGRGRGFGFRQAMYPYGEPQAAPFYAANVTPKQEAEMLKEQASAIQEELSLINKRVKELESTTNKGG